MAARLLSSSRLREAGWDLTHEQANPTAHLYDNQHQSLALPHTRNSITYPEPDVEGHHPSSYRADRGSR